MAKKQEVVEILLKLSDGGTIPILGKKAKKAGKDVDDMGRKAQNTDRAVKVLLNNLQTKLKNFQNLRPCKVVSFKYTLLSQLRFSPYQLPSNS